MFARSSQQSLGPHRAFVPDVRPLESRCLLSFAASSIKAPGRLGVAVQTGTVLTVTLNAPVTNTVQVTNDGAGYFQLEWNGGPVHFFTGVDTLNVHGEKARNDRITFNLTPPSSDPTNVSTCVQTVNGSVEGKTGGQSRAISGPQLRGTAVQNSTTLTVTVNRATTNTVHITDNFGELEVEWNGGPAQSFTGVATAIVHAEKASHDQVTLTWPTI